jgi:hypothetical protein
LDHCRDGGDREKRANPDLPTVVVLVLTPLVLRRLSPSSLVAFLKKLVELFFHADLAAVPLCGSSLGPGKSCFQLGHSVFQVLAHA